MTLKTANILLSGGVTIRARSLILYDEALLQEAATLGQEAERKLGSTGSVGFMGSPSFLLGAYASAALFSRWQANQLSREASELLEAANEKFQAALTGGREFDWSEIENSDSPDPARWHAAVFQDLKRKSFVPKPGGELLVRTEDDRWIWVMWRHVIAYEPLSNSTPSACT
jgi:hypothetical protein